MAEARVRKQHTLGLEVARERAETAAKDLAARYGAKTEWQGNRLQFKRGPIKGYITIEASSVEFFAGLGLLGGVLKKKVETRAAAILDQYFS